MRRIEKFWALLKHYLVEAFWGIAVIPLGTIVGTAFAIYYGSREIYLFYWFIMTEPYKYIDDPSLDKFRKKRFKYYALILAIGIPLWVLTH